MRGHVAFKSGASGGSPTESRAPSCTPLRAPAVRHSSPRVRQIAASRPDRTGTRPHSIRGEDLHVILRIDRIQTEMPPPSDPDPEGAARVQELMGGRFGEMSTLMNYTFQSFNFRHRQGARPFYDLIANIAAEEDGHIELVATAINTMLTGASDAKDTAPGAGLTDVKDRAVNPAHFIAGGQGALPQAPGGMPWRGDYVSPPGDLIGALTQNFFPEP